MCSADSLTCLPIHVGFGGRGGQDIVVDKPVNSPESWKTTNYAQQRAYHSNILVVYIERHRFPRPLPL